jgi:hypothetical protein
MILIHAGAAAAVIAWGVYIRPAESAVRLDAKPAAGGDDGGAVEKQVFGFAE